MATVQRAAETQGGTPRIRARGHLALVDWGDAADQAASTPMPRPPDRTRRGSLDSLYESGIAVLLLAILLAVFAILAHL